MTWEINYQYEYYYPLGQKLFRFRTDMASFCGTAQIEMIEIVDRRSMDPKKNLVLNFENYNFIYSTAVWSFKFEMEYNKMKSFYLA